MGRVFDMTAAIRGTSVERTPHALPRRLLHVDQPQVVAKGRGHTTTRLVFKYEASDMVNLANTVFTYMLTRNGGEGVTTLGVCAMQGILNDLVFQRTQLYVVPEVQCATVTQDKDGRKTRSGRTPKPKKR
jgi:hypothetical protein